MAGAVIAGAAVKGPGASTNDDSAAATKPAQASASKAQPVKGERASQEAPAKAKAPAKTQLAKNDNPAQAPQAAAEMAAPPRIDSPRSDLSVAPSPARKEAEAAKPAPGEEPVVAADEENVSVPSPRARPAFATRHAPVQAAAAREPAREAPVLAATEPAAEVGPAPRAKRERLAVRRPSRAVRVQTDEPKEERVASRVERSAQRERTRRAFERSRQPREDGSRELQARNEAEGFSLVRSRVLPDGRRVSVYRRYDEPEPRMLAYDAPRRPMMPPPFAFLGIQ